MTLKNAVMSFAILIIGSWCCTTEVEPFVPCPDRPDLMAIPEDIILAADPDLLFIIANNQMSLKAHIKKLEARACPVNNP